MIAPVPKSDLSIVINGAEEAIRILAEYHKIPVEEI